MTIDTDSVLVKCPRCGAWPIVANLPRAGSPQRGLKCRCAQCHITKAGIFAAPPQNRAMRIRVLAPGVLGGSRATDLAPGGCARETA